MNIYRFAAKGIAAFIGVDIMIAGAGMTDILKQKEAEPDIQQPSAALSTIDLPDLQSDLEFEVSELLLSGDENEASNKQELTLEDIDLSRDGTSVQGPMAEKIATDWVEPEPEPEPAPASYTREITYPVRIYSEEEIANNALTPYKVPQDTYRMFYYYDNMVDAVATPHCPEFATDDNVYLMAKIIHAEICGLGDEARRCVGTVILNRAWNSDHPNTISGVIYEKNQFSTTRTRKEPCEECLTAAYDVLYNGYRSFPHYVDAFQSIRDGYFRNHLTYVAFNDGKYKTYFSYKGGKKIITSLE